MPVTPLEIAQLWRHVNRHMRSLFRNTVGTLDLQPFSFLLLRHIDETPGITVSELSRRVGASKSHTSTITEQLVQEGYVEKRTDPADQRLLRLYGTELAKETLDRFGARAEAFWTAVFEEFPSDELKDVERVLHRLLEALERFNAAGTRNEPQSQVEVVVER